MGPLQDAGASGAARQTKVGESAAHPPPSPLWLRVGFADLGLGGYRDWDTTLSSFLAACSGFIYADGAANAACSLLSLVFYPPLSFPSRSSPVLCSRSPSTAHTSTAAVRYVLYTYVHLVPA